MSHWRRLTKWWIAVDCHSEINYENASQMPSLQTANVNDKYWLFKIDFSLCVAPKTTDKHVCWSRHRAQMFVAMIEACLHRSAHRWQMLWWSYIGSERLDSARLCHWRVKLKIDHTDTRPFGHRKAQMQMCYVSRMRTLQTLCYSL